MLLHKPEMYWWYGKSCYKSWCNMNLGTSQANQQVSEIVLYVETHEAYAMLSFATGGEKVAV